MAGNGGEGGSRSLEDTPTWALATVCFVFIFISLIIEHLIHLLSHWLKKHKKNALFEAVEKLKSVLMLLGFMSLILTATQKYISKICIPTAVADFMLPCTQNSATKTTEELRILEESSSSSHDSCESQGKTSLISEEGVNQLSMFILVLAVMQVVYTVITMALGRAKMRRWIAWEKETQTVEYQAANDPNRFRFTNQTSFGRRHMNSSFTRYSQHLLWIKCFFRQFFNSMAKVDYLTLRHGFISEHLSTNNSFNFQKYIQKTLDDDFKRVVGIRPLMWLFVVIFILADVHGSKVFLWISLLPISIMLIIGTKLEVIVTKMAFEIEDQSNVIRGTPLVQPNDSLFWFRSPNFILTLLHYTLFINAFELAFLAWATIEYGVNSCYHEDKIIIVFRVVFALTVQVMSGYITLPLYALISQMGSNFKSVILEEQTMEAVRRWHNDVKHKNKMKKQDMSQLSSNSNIDRIIMSPRENYSSLTLGETSRHNEIYADNHLSSGGNSRRSETYADNRHEIVPDQEIEMSEIIEIKSSVDDT